MMQILNCNFKLQFKFLYKKNQKQYGGATGQTTKVKELSLCLSICRIVHPFYLVLQGQISPRKYNGANFISPFNCCYGI